MKDKSGKERGIAGSPHHFLVSAEATDGDFFEHGQSDFAQDIEVKRRIIFSCSGGIFAKNDIEHTGTITIDTQYGTVWVNGGGDGVDFGVYLNSDGGQSQKPFPDGAGSDDSGMQFIDQGSQFDFAPMEIDVLAGQEIWFRVNCGPNGNNDSDEVHFTPTITYLSIDDSGGQPTDQTTVFNAADDFSATQGPVWYYLYSPIGSSDYSDLIYGYNDPDSKDYTCWDNGWFIDGTTNWTAGYIGLAGSGQIKESSGSANDALLAFKAPYSGTITLEMQNGEVGVESSAGDGVDFGVYLRSEGKLTPLCPEGWSLDASGMQLIDQGSEMPFTTMTIDILKNQVIWFRVNCGPNGDCNSDNVYFTPIITYQNITTDPGVPDEDAQSTDQLPTYNSAVDYGKAQGSEWYYLYSPKRKQ